MGGGTDDISTVEFIPGTARLAPQGLQVLNKVGQALLDRPGVHMTVAGAADPRSERDAYAAQQLELTLQAEHQREWARGGHGDEPHRPMTADERSLYLKRIYRQAEMANKPRNALGFVKDIPVADIEILLKAHTRVSVDAMRELALQRGLAVRQVLTDKGISGERVFLSAPQLRVSDEEDAAWVPTVQLTLSTR